MNESKSTWIIILLGIISIGVIGHWFSGNPEVKLGSAPAGLPAGPTFAIQYPVTAVTLAQPLATTTCSARRVSTASTTLMWTIGTSTPTASFGTFLAASSTVVIDGGVDGCGALKVFPFQTGAITVTDIR